MFSISKQLFNFFLLAAAIHPLLDATLCKCKHGTPFKYVLMLILTEMPRSNSYIQRCGSRWLMTKSKRLKRKACVGDVGATERTSSRDVRSGPPCTPYPVPPHFHSWGEWSTDGEAPACRLEWEPQESLAACLLPLWEANIKPVRFSSRFNHWLCCYQHLTRIEAIYRWFWSQVRYSRSDLQLWWTLEKGNSTVRTGSQS